MNLAWGALHAGLQSVLDTALDAVVVMDTEGRIRGWNERAQATFGWTTDDVQGHRLSELIIPHRYREAHELGLRRFLETGEGPVLNRHLEIEGLHRDGHEIPVELSITCTDQFGDTLFVGFLRDISERRAMSERQQRMLRESDHRVKNMLSVVTALATQTVRASSDLGSFESTFVARLQSIAKAHDLLTGKELRAVPLRALAEQVLQNEVEQGRAKFDGPLVLLNPRQVLGMSMILHELHTNAVKYGALCKDEGRIDFHWSVRDGQVELIWEETGAMCEGDQPSSGFGRKMMEMSAKADLYGSIGFDFRPEGLRVSLRFPFPDDPQD